MGFKWYNFRILFLVNALILFKFCFETFDFVQIFVRDFGLFCTISIKLTAAIMMRISDVVKQKKYF